MGEIIRFRPRHGARPTSTANPETGALRESDAMIFLFTGVRYERHEEIEIKSVKRPGRPGGGRRRA